MTEYQTDNAQEMISMAEKALASGNFLRANRIVRDTSRVIDRTMNLHRKFLKKMEKFIDRITDMEEKGYDISEAMDILQRARERAMVADYDKAMDTMKMIKSALNRATYMPFPLLNKTVDIISTIFYSSGKVSYTVRIENPTEEPLGEIIMRPSFSTDDFHEVPEKPYGMIGPREYKEYTFFLSPKKGKDWSLGVGGEILMEGGVTMRTKLSSREGEARYLVVLENNNDQVLRDIVIAPQTPGGLRSDPPNGLIDTIGPFSSGSVTFDLTPAALNHEGYDQGEKVVVMEDEKAYVSTGPDDFEIIEGEEEFDFDDDIPKEKDEEMTEPRDFTPVKERYNLIEMAPNKIPEDMKLNKNVSRRRK